MDALLDALWKEITTNQFFSGAALGGALLAVLASLRTVPGKILHWLRYRYTVNVSLTSFDDAWDYAHQWLLEQPIARTNQRFRVRGIKRDSDEALRAGLAPHEGWYHFRFNGKRVFAKFNRSTPSLDSGTFHLYEEMTIAYFGRDMATANAIMEAVKERYDRRNDHGSEVYVPVGWNWSRHDPIHYRSIESVITRDGALEQLIADIDQFCSREAWYAERNVPYRRGYLLHGPPGCGKTSAIYAIASHLRVSVYSLSLSLGTSNDAFLALMSRVPPGQLLVLEDVDAMFNGRESNADGLSFSTFLNCLDGLCSRHGSIVIMTTNYRDKLDPALLRPGRADVQIEFNACDRDMARRFYARFTSHAEDSQEAIAFAKRADGWTPAEVQGHLLTTTETTT